MGNISKLTPILYEKGETNFNHNGLGKLTKLLVNEIDEVLNGELEAFFEYPANGHLADEIDNEMYIKAKPNKKDEPHVFKIYDYELDTFTQTYLIYARSKNIEDLRNNVILNANVKDLAPTQAWNLAKNNALDPVVTTFYSDITTTSSVHWERRSLLSTIAGQEGSMIQYWGGEIKHDINRISLLRRRGQDNVTTVRHGKNLDGLKATYSTKGLVTAIVPYYVKDNDKAVYGDVVESEYINNYPSTYYDIIEYNDEELGLTQEDEPEGGWEDSTIRTELNRVAKRYFDENVGKDLPSINMEISLEDISQTKEYENFKDFEQIEIGDTITVYSKKFDLNINAKVRRVVYNGLTDKNELVEVGTARRSLYDDVRDEFKKVETELKEGIDHAMASADGKNTIYHGTADPNEVGLVGKNNDTYFRTNGQFKEIWSYLDGQWHLEVGDLTGEQIKADIAEQQQAIEEAKLKAIADSEQALADAKAHAEAEDARIRVELESDIGGAIEIAEQAKADATAKANQALEDAKAHAEAEDARIRGELESDIGGAVSLAEQAKADAVTKANQALVDAKTYADAEIVLIETQFDGIIEGVESDVAVAKQTADSALHKINNDISDRFDSLDIEVLAIETISNSAQVNAQTALNQSLDALGDASTALANAQTALNRANDVRDTADILSGQVSGFETTLAGFNQTVNNYTGQVSGFRNDILGLESIVASYETELDEFGNTVSTYATEVSTLTNTVSGFQSKVSKVEQDYAGISGTVATHTSQISNINGQIALKANTTTVNALTGRVTTAETGITANANAIKLKASQSSVDTLAGTVQSLGTDIGVVAGQISSKVWNTDIETAVDRIEVGGRNLLKDTSDDWTELVRPEGNWFYGSLTDTEIKAGETYTFSIIVEKVSDDNVPINLHLGLGEVPNRYGWDFPTWLLNNIPLDGRKVSITHTVTESDVANNRSFFAWRLRNERRETTIRFKEVKLEKGNKATDWTPAPEDTTDLINHVESELTQKYDSIIATVSSVDGRVAQQKITLDSIVSTVSDIQEDAEGTTTLLNQTASTVNTQSSTLATIRTDLDGKATITQFNTLTSTVNGTIQRVGNAEGRLTTVETNVNGLQTTVASKASQTLVTQLANGLSSVVTDLGNLEIGGRNYYKKDTPFRLKSGMTTLIKGHPEAPNGWAMTGVAGNSGGVRIYNVIDSNGYWTVSFKYRGTQNVNVSFVLDINDVGQTTFRTSSDNTWRYAELTVNVTNYSENVYNFVNFDSIAHAHFRIDDFKVEKGNKATDWTPAPEDTQSQISQLSDNINLRVAKGDVINQINVSTEGILIDGSRTHITGTTTIDNGVIKNAHIGDLNATKITAGIISAARLNAPAIVTAGLTANVIKSTHIETSTATVEKIFATDAMVNILAAKTAFITSVKAVDIDAARITSGTISAARINATAIVTAGLTANVVKSTHIETSTATIDKLFATDAMVTRLTAKTAFINSIKAVDIDAARITSGTINASRLNAGAIVTAGLTANVIKSTHISADTALFDKLFSTSSATDRLSARTAWITDANIVNASISGVKIADATITSAKISALDVSKISGNTTEFVRSAWNAGLDNTTIDASGIYMTGSGTWRRTYITPTGFDLYNGLGGGNKAGAIGYLKSSGSEATYGENVMGNAVGGRHMIGIGVNASHDIAFGYNNDSTTNRFFKKSLQVDGDTGRIRVYRPLHPGVSNYSIDFTSWDGAYGVYGAGFSHPNSGIAFTGSGTKIWDESAKTWDTYNMTTRQRIGFYGDSGIQVETAGRSMEIWAGGSSVVFYTSTNSRKFLIGDGVIAAYADLNMNSYRILNQSDRRLKTDITKTNNDSLEKITNIEFVDFNWLTSGKDDFGIVAQQVQRVAPELIVEVEDGYLGINSTRLNMMTAHAVKELALRELNTNRVASQALQLVESIKSEIDELREENRDLRNRIEELESAA